jgi:hypothetical protein
MSPHQIIAVAVRLFAVWLAIHLPGQSYAFYFEGSKMNQPYVGLITAAITVAVLLVILALWYFPMSIARKLLSASNPEAAPVSTPNTWLTMGCALIGLSLLTDSLPALVRDGLILFSARNDFANVDYLKNSVLYLLVMVIISLWLILGARGFSRVLRWAQHAGTIRASGN